MNSRISVPERALLLARAGICRNIQDVRRQLSKERYDQVDAHLSGQSIKAQLNAAFKARLPAKDAPRDE